MKLCKLIDSFDSMDGNVDIKWPVSKIQSSEKKNESHGFYLNGITHIWCQSVK
jgi:hypothetical protein